MTLFFDQHIKKDTQNVRFSNEESKHLYKVLRKKSGDLIRVTNGKGLAWEGRLDFVAERGSVAVIEKVEEFPMAKRQLHLAIAPTKNMSRMEWLVEKLTELGIQSITPLLCQHSERKVIKPERLQKIMMAALKQSQQYFIPQLHPMQAFHPFLAQLQGTGHLAHCYPQHKTPLKALSLQEEHTTLFIGPEGDFSPEEVAAAEARQVTMISLGPQRFRTETAGLLGCHSLLLNSRL